MVLSGAPRLQMCFIQVLFCSIRLSSILSGTLLFIPTQTPVLAAVVTCGRQR